MGSIFKNVWFWLVLVVILAMLFFAHGTRADRPYPSIPEQAVRYIFTPIQREVSQIRFSLQGVEKYFVTKDHLDRENKKLKAQLDRLQLENQQLKEYRNEAERLQGILGFRDYSPQYKLLGARVIARSPSYWNDFLFIDRGSSDGVKNDMVVITPDGLVGRILNVQKNASEVLLITNRESGVGTVVQETRAPGIVNGMGSYGDLTMNNIPYFVKIYKGDEVITSGLGSIFPPGIPVGKVTSVKADQSGLTRSAQLRPAADLDRLEEVLVVLSYQGPAASDESAMIPGSGKNQIP